ncbi:dihydrolipoyl dehydrogenase [Coxiella burnetii]|uniref:dihydrolipoyl dehydrogenase n=1 Tax=Coxiella burnetii TaxID=777 RepID=UPI0000ED00A7|nr:dihydrolipoyl dehydrogenase [Coxiella burnetii]ACJ20570.1 dihydrolipoamide dehydrogenase [Coxiella burnetii CbuK_Q154]ATN86193.1 dihydrolipoamide dehydrogenase [Coxiella burnetii str. Schperling]EDR35424.1 dihydrolipoyl dehydrogenase, E3 component of pyruvate dehydrogenases complex [Coxiella burnetii Q321]PHH57323.1 dihydrolipoyl dehydrogenase [Coxiella burnetii]UYK70116.1 dihydrolipoyl dehydrogenase [Coxiella burnetii]
MTKEIKTEVVVLGSGPGGYAAVFRAADLGKKVVLVERYETIGGVCLNVGCIPSKALLHVAKVIDDAKDMSSFGIDFGKAALEIEKIRSWKENVVKKLTGGLKMMAKQRKVEIITGYGKFSSSNELAVENKEKSVTKIKFDQAIIAVGSLPVKLPFIPDDPRIMDSTGALELEDVKGHLLVLGGGIIGLEMATVYHALGTKISVVEMMDQLIPGADADVVKPLHQRIQKRYEEILLKTKVTKIEPKKDGLYVTFEGENAPKEPKKYDRILVAVGRSPNGKLIDAEKAGVKVDDKGYIAVDKQMRTNVSHIYAIGDVVGQPMLAHKATYEGRLAAEVIAGKKHYNDARCIPAVAYTDPEVAWVGLTETQAKEKGIKYEKGVFPWAASGRALSLNRSEGSTKLLFDEKGTVIGGGIVGVNAGDLISEVALAIEMGCDAEDVGLTIHPHPTLSETVMMACEMFEGTITDLIPPKKKDK